MHVSHTVGRLVLFIQKGKFGHTVEPNELRILSQAYIVHIVHIVQQLHETLSCKSLPFNRSTT
jgi:hypothetical protein